MGRRDPRDLDEDVILAAIDLAARGGGSAFELSYKNDPTDNPAAFAARGPEWWATVLYRGARITVEGFARPDAAAQALADRLLTGAKCRCGRLVALDDHGAWTLGDRTLADGSTWTAEEATSAGQCRWRRRGARWEPSCPTPPGRNRAGRRTGGRQ